MDNVIKSDTVTMINLRGGLRSVQASLVPELKAQGWKIVINPRRDYFPELDQGNKEASGNQNAEIDDEAEAQNMLRFEDC